MSTEMRHQVVVICDETGKVEKIGEPNKSLRMAEKVEAGLGINLNWDRYSTAIQPVHCNDER
jgi:hypothetical protein